MTKVDINTRELCVSYPTWEQLVDRFAHITKIIEEDLLTMGNKQKISTVKIQEVNSKYKLIYTLDEVK